MMICICSPLLFFNDETTLLQKNLNSSLLLRFSPELYLSLIKVLHVSILGKIDILSLRKKFKYYT